MRPIVAGDFSPQFLFEFDREMYVQLDPNTNMRLAYQHLVDWPDSQNIEFTMKRLREPIESPG